MDKTQSEGLELILKGFSMLIAGAIGNGGSGPVKRAFTLREAAKYCGIGKTTLGDYKKIGRIDTAMIGGRPKYLIEDLDRLIEELKKEGKCPRLSHARTGTTG